MRTIDDKRIVYLRNTEVVTIMLMNPNAQRDSGIVGGKYVSFRWTKQSPYWWRERRLAYKLGYLFTPQQNTHEGYGEVGRTDTKSPSVGLGNDVAAPRSALQTTPLPTPSFRIEGSTKL